MILMADDEWLQKIRPALQSEINGVASLTQAVPGMLEVLPYGSSKGDGVSKLLEHIGVSPDDTVGKYNIHSISFHPLHHIFMRTLLY